MAICLVGLRCLARDIGFFAQVASCGGFVLWVWCVDFGMSVAACGDGGYHFFSSFGQNTPNEGFRELDPQSKGLLQHDGAN